MITRTGRARLAQHSPIAFLRGQEEAIAEMQVAHFLRDLRDGRLQAHGADARLWLRALEWDSTYFGFPVHRIEFADWNEDLTAPAEALAAVLRDILATARERRSRAYFFADVPSEDTAMLQALGSAGFRLVETRLTYVHDEPGRVKADALAACRVASDVDADELRRVGRVARNAFDRYHADPFFGQRVADDYVGEYAAQCARGFADVVLVPGDGQPAGAFVCGQLAVPSPGPKIGRLALAAVDAPRRGWYRTLGEALLRWMGDRDVAHVANTTQSTNRAVIHVTTQLGYRFGRASHILAAGVEPEGALRR